MHRDNITHIVVTPSDFVITASRDGQIKFWKKLQAGIEFVKHFRAHMEPISGLAASVDGSLLATTAADKAYKIFDVLSFDMIQWVKLDFVPTVCEWVGGGSSGGRALLAVADADGPSIRLFDAAEGEGTLVRTLSIHAAPVLQIRHAPLHDAVISCDARGVLEYWENSGDFGMPKDLDFRYKTETDLYALAKAKAAPTSLAVSPDGVHFAVTSTDYKVRLYRFASGKVRRTFDEGYDSMHLLQKEGDDAYRLESFDFGRRMAVEREYRAATAPAPSNALFDRTGRFLIYPSVLGIKLISVGSSTLARLLGKV